MSLFRSLPKAEECMLETFHPYGIEREPVRQMNKTQNGFRARPLCFCPMPQRRSRTRDNRKILVLVPKLCLGTRLGLKLRCKFLCTSRRRRLKQRNRVSLASVFPNGVWEQEKRFLRLEFHDHPIGHKLRALVQLRLAESVLVSMLNMTTTLLQKLR